jgi:sucrose-6F-phosphate phosphohydrolase
MTPEKLLVCTDLDRTLLPNGHAEESPLARPLFRLLAQRQDTTIAYVSGRHKQLLLDAIAEYELPLPDYAIGDVGTSLYRITAEDWQPVSAWSEAIAADWGHHSHSDIAVLLDDLQPLRLQEAEKQNTFKLSYYLPVDIDRVALLKQISDRLEQHDIRASLIWSIDDLTHQGLLDILPASATKKHAVEFLMTHTGFDNSNTVYAGDSGNDLPVITSDIPAILVANTREDVKAEALGAIQATGNSETLYIATGRYFGLNGNYAAGIIEGVVHYFPDNLAWLQQGIHQLSDR